VKTSALFVVCMLLSTCILAVVPASSGSNTASVTTEVASSFPVGDILGSFFSENKGQLRSPDVLFYSQQAQFTSSGVSIRVVSAAVDTTYVFMMDFPGATQVAPIGKDLLPHQSNFFYGSEPSGWVTGACNYGTVVYPGLYDGIDLAYHATADGMKYEFLVQPGARVEDIRLAFEGVTLSTDGTRLFLGTGGGTLVDDGIYSYQITPEGRRTVGTTLVLDGNVLSYRVSYDPGYPLVIDPLIYSTYIGGNESSDGASSVAVDSSNNAYITGYTNSDDFPTTPGAYDTTDNNNLDVFVMKMNSAGSGPIYSTYIGSPTAQEWESGASIVLDASNNAYVTGGTNGNDFPTTLGAFDRTYNGAGDYDAFVLELNSTGSGLIFSTLVGGSNSESGSSIVLDSQGNPCVMGYTSSLNFPTTPGAFDTTFNGGSDAFLLKLNATGTALIYSTFIGGSKDESSYTLWVGAGRKIVLDAQDNAWMAGVTNSSDFPTTANAYNKIRIGGFDAFVLGLRADGTGLVYSSYFGGSKDELGATIALMPPNDVVFTGWTDSEDFPMVPVAYAGQYIGDSIFVTRLHVPASGPTSVVFSSVLSSSGHSEAMALDAMGNIVIAGYAMGGFKTTPLAYDTTYNGAQDGFLLKMTPTGNRVVYATYFGGAMDDEPYGLAFGPSGDAFVVGETRSNDMPTTPGAFDRDHIGGTFEHTDAFALRIALPYPPSVPQGLAAKSGDSFVQLNWSQPSFDGGSSLQLASIFRGPSPSDLTSIANVTYANGYNDTFVENGKTYYYAVLAINEGCEGDLSNAVKGTPTGPPSKPLNGTATGKDGYILLDWSPPGNSGGPPVKGYDIYKGISVGGVVNLALLQKIGNTTTFNDTKVTNGVVYYYAISAENALGEGEMGNRFHTTPGCVPKALTNAHVADGDSFVALNWSEPYSCQLPLLNYYVYRGITWTGINLLKKLGNVTNFTDDQVENGITYFYQVSGVNMLGEGARSAIMSASPGTPPGAPGLHAEGTKDVINLGWAPPMDTGGAPIDWFKIYRGLQKDNLTSLTWGDWTEYHDSSVTPGLTYYYSLTAVNSHGEGPRSPVVSAMAVGVPGRPTALVLTAKDKALGLTWAAPNITGGRDIINYKVYRALGQTPLAFLTEASEPLFNDTNVTKGKDYTYAVSALNEFGEGSRTEPANLLYITAPGAVLAVNMTDGNGTVRLEWAYPADDGGSAVLGYRIYRGTSKDNITLFFGTAGIPYLDTTVINGQVYYYRVAAFNKVGVGAPSKDIVAQPGTPPTAPLDLKVRTSGNKVVLSWKDPVWTGGLPVQGYKVYRGTSKDDLVEIATVKELTFADKNVTEGKQYYYQVTALNKKGEGQPTTIVRASVESPMKLYLLPTLIMIIIILVIAIVVVAFVVRRKKQVM